MTIEEHYENLRVQADSFARRRDAELGNVHLLSYAAREEIAVLATQLAAEDWPRIRRSLAAEGWPMPSGPLRFALTGFNVGETAYGSICRSRKKVGVEIEADYVALAIDQLRTGKWAREAALAQDEWECYRRAVEQGVAIAPADPNE